MLYHPDNPEAQLFLDHRIEGRPDIVRASCREVFIAAARNPYACSAAILEVSEEQKAREDAILQKMWEESIAPNHHFYVGGWYHKTPSNDAESHFEMCTPPEKAKPIMTDIANLYCQITYAPKCEIEIRRNWRQDPDDRPHDTHEFSVLNRVFLENGTELLGDKTIQVNKGDYLFMHPKCPHQPEAKTVENATKKRLTMVAYVPAKYL